MHKKQYDKKMKEIKDVKETNCLLHSKIKKVNEKSAIVLKDINS